MVTGQLTEERQCSLLMSTCLITETFNVTFNVTQEHKLHKLQTRTTNYYETSDCRIKMCTEVNTEDFTVVHHEMGHIEYFMQYRHLANLFRAGANAAFHEAVGDTIALSVGTMQHLRAVHLSDIDTDKISQGIHNQDFRWGHEPAQTTPGTPRSEAGARG